jgi:prepilin-type N-terminal cleavage/methylation domain-containing protein
MSRTAPALRRLRREDGFTLSEQLTTLAVLSIFLAAVALVLSNAIRSSSAVEDQGTNQTEVRAAMDALASDLRQAYADDTTALTVTTSTSSPQSMIPTWTGTQLDFYTPDRLTPFHLRRLSYRLSGGTLQRAQAISTNTGAPPWAGVLSSNLGAYATLVRNVKNTTLFTYLQADKATPATSLANLALIRVTVTLTANGTQGRTSTFITDVYPNRFA